MPASPALAGQRFGAVVVLYPARHRGAQILWACRCDCGATCYLRTYILRHHETPRCRACGYRASSVAQRHHGQCGTPIYVAWHDMLRRHPGEVCAAWHDFATFAAALGPRPEGGRLQRLDRRQPYGPGNAVWRGRLKHSPSHKKSP